MRLWVTGYRSYELGTFGDQDPKIKVIKFALKQVLKAQLDEGLEWVITGGQLGIEQWAVSVVQELKSDYPDLKVAMMMPFKNFGNQWQSSNQEKLQDLITQSDFAESVSTQEYQGASQLRSYQQFMLSHTDGALLVYDADYPGKTQFDSQTIQVYQQKTPYPLTQIDMLALQDYATDYEEQRIENIIFDE